MLRDITLGQYFPGNSPIHRLDPRAKLLFVILYIAAVFSSKNYLSFAVILLFTLGIILLSRISFRTILKSLKPILFIMLFTVVMNIFWSGGEHLLFSFGFIHIYAEGLRFAILTALRLVLLVSGTFVLLSYTTSPVALTDAIERLTHPLSKIGVPTHEFAMMMSIALRFIPLLIEETDKIMSAQKARGANFETGSLISRAKAMIPILIPLFISSFRRADELAAAMECRLYHGGTGRTRLKVLKLSALDYAAAVIFAALLAAVLFLNAYFGDMLILKPIG